MTPEELEMLNEDPVTFIEVYLGQELWGKQKEIVLSVWENKRTMVASCHGSGKTNVVARLALTWLILNPYSVVVTTAPTQRQVVKQLWKEIRAAYRKAKEYFGGDLLPKAPVLQLDGDDWMLIGFSTNDSDAFQGWHSYGGNLFIFDEATGIDQQIWKAVQGCLTSENDRLIGIGNPTDPNSEFAAQYAREGVNSIHISAFDTPNVQQNKEVIKGLVSSEWIKEMQEECGPSYEEHPDYISRVLGKFPDKDARALVPGSWVDAAVEKWKLLNEGNGWLTTSHLGCDVARAGGAKTVFAEGYERLGVRELVKEPSQDTMATAGRIIQCRKEMGCATSRIDADGLGAGIADRCTELEGRIVFHMRGGMKSDVVDKDGLPKYLNKRAEWYWTLRDRLDPKDQNSIALPPDKQLRSQLTSIRWKTNSRGVLQIESKDEMAKRGMKSPDEADAVVYAMANPGENTFDVVDHLSAMARL